MILSLEQLRRDYKVYRKKDQEVAARIDILLSYSKFELKYQGPELQETFLAPNSVEKLSS